MGLCWSLLSLRHFLLFGSCNASPSTRLSQCLFLALEGLFAPALTMFQFPRILSSSPSWCYIWEVLFTSQKSALPHYSWLPHLHLLLSPFLEPQNYIVLYLLHTWGTMWSRDGFCFSLRGEDKLSHLISKHFQILCRFEYHLFV